MENPRKSKSWPEIRSATQEIITDNAKKASSANGINMEHGLKYPTKINATDKKKKATKYNKNSNLKFLYTNADQLVNKRDDLIMFITDDEPDIMLITEVIPNCQNNPIATALLNIDGYNCNLNFDHNTANLGQSGIRGVAIYSRKSLHAIEIEVTAEGAYDHVWIEIPSKHGESILCGCVYRTQSGDTDMNGCMQSTNAIRELMTKACQYNKNVVIAGDFNYKNIDWENQLAINGHRHLADFIESLQDCFMFQHVTEPTRYRVNEANNILDLILSSEEGMVQDLSYHPRSGQSDHICMEFKLI